MTAAKPNRLRRTTVVALALACMALPATTTAGVTRTAPLAAASRCDRVVHYGGPSSQAAVIAEYRHLSCATARAVATSLLRGGSRQGFSCRPNPKVHAGGGQDRCTRGRSLVVVNFE